MRRSSLRADVESREHAVLSLLDRWPWSEGSVVIGGYALAAYDRPRYSEDLDIVIPTRGSDRVQAWLESEGFRLQKSWPVNPQNFDAKAHRYSNGQVTVDLLIGAVRDRDARIDLPSDWVARGPVKTVLRALTGRTSVAIPVARIEALWALKLQAGRDQDVTDLFSIYGRECSQAEIKEEFQSFNSETLSNKLKQTVRKMGSEKLYLDSMSRLGKKPNNESRNRWRTFVEFAEGCLPS